MLYDRCVRMSSAPFRALFELRSRVVVPHCSQQPIHAKETPQGWLHATRRFIEMSSTNRVLSPIKAWTTLLEDHVAVYLTHYEPCFTVGCPLLLSLFSHSFFVLFFSFPVFFVPGHQGNPPRLPPFGMLSDQGHAFSFHFPRSACALQICLSLAAWFAFVQLTSSTTPAFGKHRIVSVFTGIELWTGPLASRRFGGCLSTMGDDSMILCTAVCAMACRPIFRLSRNRRRVCSGNQYPAMGGP